MEITEDGPVLALGSGWYPLESFRETHFRWVNNDAELMLATLNDAVHTLELTVEPGPGVGLKPFALTVAGGEGWAPVRVDVVGRQSISLPIPSIGPAIHRLVLRCEGGGAPMKDDPRVLNFRVFRMRLCRERSDVVPHGVDIGRDWYALESFAGETFRWIGAQASVTIQRAFAAESLALELEPGPGVEFKPFTLMISCDGDQRVERTVTGRQRVEIPVQPGAAYQLKIAEGGKASPGDPRVLNARVFRAQ